jgi:hypothetical protein
MIAAYIDHYHDRPHSRLDYRTPREVRATWDDARDNYKNSRPEPPTREGSGPAPPLSRLEEGGLAQGW